MRVLALVAAVVAAAMVVAAVAAGPADAAEREVAAAKEEQVSQAVVVWAGGSKGQPISAELPLRVPGAPCLCGGRWRWHCCFLRSWRCPDFHAQLKEWRWGALRAP